MKTEHQILKKLHATKTDNGIIFCFLAFLVHLTLTLRLFRQLFSHFIEFLEISVCGRAYRDIDTLISGGTEERSGDSPWHAAIYDWEKILICGGTIIHEKLIVTGKQLSCNTDSIRCKM